MNELSAMLTGEATLSLSAVRAVAWTLLHFFWQGALVAALLAGTLILLRRRSAKVRYVAACVALLAMAMMPVATAILLWPSADTVGEAVLIGESKVHPSAGAAVAEVARGAAMASPSFQATSASSLTVFEPALPWLVAAWLAGVVALSLIHAVGWLRVRRLRHHGARPAEQPWRHACQRIACRLGIRRMVELLESTRVSTPMVVGWLKPVVLFPASTFTGLNSKQLESILAHELAHVRRHDYLVNVLQVALETLLFYHPAVWWASRQVRTLREHCCDDLAVEVCGDRMVYAGALADLEELRFATPVFALGADGGSLLERIRRLAGVRPADETWTPGWIAGTLAAVAMTACVVVLAFAGRPGLAQEGMPEAGDMQEIHVREPESPRRGASILGVTPMVLAQVGDASQPGGSSGQAKGRSNGGSIEGRWIAEEQDHGVWLQLKRKSRGRHGGTTSMTIPAEDLSEVGVGSDVRFELRRQAGTLTFTGAMDADGMGSGRFTFNPDREFTREMAALGYDDLSSDQTFEAALFDVTTDYVQELSTLGYDDVPFERLVELQIHGVSSAYIGEIAGLGYEGLSLQRLVEMRIHGVSPEFIAGMAEAGYSDLPARKLVEMRIHGVSPDFVREMAAIGIEDLPAQKLIEMRIHGVSPDFVREMAANGYDSLSAQRLVEMRIHGVSPEFVREMTAIGLEDLSARKLVEMRIHGVSSDFMREMAAIGLEGVPAQKFVEMRIHGVSPDFVREMGELGYRDLPVSRWIEMRIHGVGPDFVRKLEDRGYTDVPANKLIEMRIHGLDKYL